MRDDQAGDRYEAQIRVYRIRRDGAAPGAIVAGPRQAIPDDLVVYPNLTRAQATALLAGAHAALKAAAE